MQEIINHFAKSVIDNAFDWMRSSINEKKEKRGKLIKDIELLHKGYLDFYDHLTSLLAENQSEIVSKAEAKKLLQKLNFDSGYKLNKARLLSHAVKILDDSSQTPSEDKHLATALIQYLTIDVADGNLGEGIEQMASPITGLRQYLFFGVVPRDKIRPVYQDSNGEIKIADEPLKREQLFEIIEHLRDIHNSYYFQIIHQLNKG